MEPNDAQSPVGSDKPTSSGDFSQPSDTSQPPVPSVAQPDSTPSSTDPYPSAFIDKSLAVNVHLDGAVNDDLDNRSTLPSAQAAQGDCSTEGSWPNELSYQRTDVDGCFDESGVFPTLNAPTSDPAIDNAAPDELWAIDDDDDDNDFLLQVQMQVTQAVATVPPPEPANHPQHRGKKGSQRRHPNQTKSLPPHENPQTTKRTTATRCPTKKCHSAAKPCELPPIVAAEPAKPPPRKPSLDSTAATILPPLAPTSSPADDLCSDVDPITILSWGEIPATMEALEEGALEPTLHNLNATPEAGQEHLYLHEDDKASSPTTSEARVQDWLRQKRRVELLRKKQQQQAPSLVVDKAKRQAASDSQYRAWVAQKKQQHKREKAAAVAKKQKEQNQRLTRLQAQAIEIQTIQAHTKARLKDAKTHKKPRRKRRKRAVPAPLYGSDAHAETPFSKHEREVADTMQKLDDVERVLAEVAARALRIP